MQIKHLLVGGFAVVGLSITLTACLGDGNNPPPASNTITSSGGTLTLADGAVKLEFPAGAVAADTTIGVTAIAALPVDGVPGTVFEFSPDGIKFAKPVRLTLKYDPAKIPAGTLEKQLELAKVKTDGWIPLETTVDDTAKTLSADMNGFSSYGAIPTVKAWTFGADATGAKVDVTRVAADSLGNVYVIGKSSTYGGSSTSTVNYGSAFISSFSRDGQIRIGYPKRIVLPEGYRTIEIYGIASSGGGDAVCITGRVFNTSTILIETLITCYNQNGQTQIGWPKIFPENQEGIDIALDSRQNVYVSGYTQVRLEAGQPYRGNGDVYVTSFTPNGMLRPGWPRQFGTTEFDTVNIYSLALDSSANVYLTWYPFSNNIIDNPVYLESLTTDGVRRSGFPKEIRAGTIGSNLYSLMTVDVVGNQVVTWSNNSASNNPFSISTFNPSGNVRSGWPQLERAPFQVQGIATDSTANIFLTGRIRATNGKEDVWLTSFTTDGAVRSGYPKILGSDGNDSPTGGLAINPIGDVFLAGTTDGTFQGAPLPSGATNAGFISRVRGY
jgi:Beta-propeller repeat